MACLCNIGRTGSIILVTIILSGWVVQGAEPLPLPQLTCQQFAMTLQLERSVLSCNAPVSLLNIKAASSEDSSSWVPRILIPIAAVVVVGTATYLIFSMRG